MRTLLAFIVTLAFVLPTTVVTSQSSAKSKRSRKKPSYCPKTKKKPLKVYAIGSSTMGNVLGRVLQKEFKKVDVKVKYWGKASTGLARPDFHDWIAKAPKIIKKYKPDLFIVSLGTNDGQHLNAGKYKWIKYQDTKWAKEYGNRVEKLLKVLSGKKGHRPVIWLGPTALPQERFAKRMKRIRKIIRNRIRKFKKKAVFIDGIALTTDKKGAIKQKLKVPGRKKPVRARAKDNVHLTERGVRWLLAEPILKRVKRCL
jgi:uncharacterized protein